MNPLIRLCGPNISHDLRDLSGRAERKAGSATADPRLRRAGDAYMPCPGSVGLVTAMPTAFRQLAEREDKECDGQPNQCEGVQTGKPGKVDFGCQGGTTPMPDWLAELS